MVPAFTLSTQAFWLCLVRVHPAGVLNPKQTDSPLNLAGGGRCCPAPDFPPAVAPPPPPPLLLGPAEPFPLAADLIPLRLAAAFGCSSVFFFSLASILSHLNSNKKCYVIKCRLCLLKTASLTMVDPLSSKSQAVLKQDKLSLGLIL
jgi:hypothetical protein